MAAAVNIAPQLRTMTVAVNIATNHNPSSVDPAGAAQNPDDARHKLLHVSFNQDRACFAAALTSGGFRVYDCHPFRERLRRDVFGGRTGAVEMLFQTNMFALVGNAGNPRNPPNEAVIWDEQRKRYAGRLLACGSPVRGVRLRRDRAVVVLNSSVCVYGFPDLRRPMCRYETAPNPRGLCAVTPLRHPNVLACLGPREGQVMVVESYGEDEEEEEEGRSARRRLINAHPSSALACLALSQDGRLLAAAGAGAGSVRVFDVAEGKLLREVDTPAASETHGLAFSSDSRFLAVSGDGGTVQVFALRLDAGDDDQDTCASHYTSVSRFKAGDGERCVVEFGAQANTVVVVTMGGSFYRCRFDPVTGGEMTQLERCDFM